MPDLAAAALAALPPDLDAVAVRDGARWIIGAGPDSIVEAENFDVLDRLRDGWWAGWCTYELGHCVERVVPAARAGARNAPATLAPAPLHLARFDARLIVEPHRVYVEGDGEARGFLLDAARVATAGAPALPVPTPLAPWESSLDRDAFCDRVRTIIGHIEAGDCYQVNLTRMLTSPVAADPVALFAGLCDANPAPHAAFVRAGDVAVVSASPERFMRRDGDRIETRPIKGTAPAGAAGEALLAASAKDRAENVMIVDLARNDLGRVSAFGTVTVPDLCAIERHPGVAHLVSTVQATLRPGTALGALLRALSPAASITGAPKPRVMQLIEDLEPVGRGIYCGSVGWIDANRHIADFNVAIRTFTITPGRTQLGVGAGIVADSDPGLEWEETELKASRLLAVADLAAVL